MKCVACKTGTTEPGRVTFSVDRGGAVVVVRGVPAAVCATCGEEYLDMDTMRELEAIVQRAVQDGTDVAVQQYRAA